ncbi:hypothetical protein [Microbulbifer sp. MCCC 1A16149]|uniref:hypothetical protein n=1 Tax=Microbulbifer sp. MCCC 1A16149 TaxID=3411322 RepID=UPI003D0D5304
MNKDITEFLVAISKPSIGWWPFPFMRPIEGEEFGVARYLTCILLYPTFIWCFSSLIIFLKTNGGFVPYLGYYFIGLFIAFLVCFSLMASAWNKVYGASKP